MAAKQKLKTLGLAAVLLSGFETSQAAVIDFDWSGLFTMLDPNGRPLLNSSYPYYSDPTWGYGFRTQIHGSLTFDADTGAGTGSIAPFEFFNGGPIVVPYMELLSIGDGFGGPGSLIVGRMPFDWGFSENIYVDIVFDAEGLLIALTEGVVVGDVITGGVIPASNDMRNGAYPIGPAVMATSTYNSDFYDCVSYNCYTGAYISGNDTIGGSPMDNGPFLNFSINLDVTSMVVNHCEGCADPSPVPVPAAFWLTISGLLGLAGSGLRNIEARLLGQRSGCRDGCVNQLQDVGWRMLKKIY